MVGHCAGAWEISAVELDVASWAALCGLNLLVQILLYIGKISSPKKVPFKNLGFFGLDSFT